MSQNTQTAIRLSPTQGTLVGFSDFLREQNANRAQIGKGIAAQQGSYNALPQQTPLFSPLQVTTNGTMVVTVGGTNQIVLCDGWLCDGCLPQQFTVPNNSSGSVRTDLIAIQYALVDDGTEADQDESGSGTITTVTNNLVADGLNYQYIEGNASGAAPAAPSGFNAFATITVASGATALTAAQITYLFPVMNSSGPQGIPGAQGATGPSPNPRGTWSNSATYNPLDIVNYGGSGYIVNLASAPPVGIPPSESSAWTLLSAVGPQGTPGINGSNGTNGTNGSNGANGNTGQQGPAPWTTTTASAVVPAIGGSSSFPVVRPDAFPLGTYCVISDGTNAFYGIVNKSGSPLGVTCLAQQAGGTGSTIASGATVTFSGIPGATGPAGASAVSNGNLCYGGDGNTNSSGYLFVYLPYQVIGATAIVRENTDDARPIICSYDQQQSYPQGGLVVFKAIAITAVAGGGYPQGQGDTVAGVGLNYTIITNTAKAV